MDNHPSESIPSSRYNDFLFASICEEANGMRLSVLSALARMDVDPWEQARCLASMPRAIAEKTLISTLDLISARSWKRSEAEAVAARLVRLLPEGERAKSVTVNEVSVALAKRTAGFWLVSLFFAIAVSFLSLHQQATTDANQIKSISSTATPAQSDSAEGKPPNLSDQRH